VCGFDSWYEVCRKKHGLLFFFWEPHTQVKAVYSQHNDGKLSSRFPGVSQSALRASESPRRNGCCHVLGERLKRVVPLLLHCRPVTSLQCIQARPTCFLTLASLWVRSPWADLWVSKVEGLRVSGHLCSLLLIFALGFEGYCKGDGRLFTFLCSILRNSTQACIDTVNAGDAEVTMLDGNHMFEEVGSGRVSTLTIVF
jgi:hypothetical protein